eukprot:7486611-Pyramimonas_sp.AAC.2
MWQALIGFLVTTLLIPTALGNLAWLCTERTEGKMCNDATPIHPAAASKYTAEIKGNVGKLVYLDVPGGVGGHVCALARYSCALTSVSSSIPKLHPCPKTRALFGPPLP